MQVLSYTTGVMLMGRLSIARHMGTPKRYLSQPEKTGCM